MQSPSLETHLEDADLTPALRADLARLAELEEEVRLAQQVQQELLQRTLPEINGLDIQTWYAPGGQVSGDTYDIYRLDESHIAIALADATGHGVHAALLSAFARRSIQAGDYGSDGPRLLSPSEVLERLNKDMLDLKLSQCQFLASLYAVYDQRTRILTWARAGSPYPIITRAGQAPVQIKSDGPLIGVLDDARFETAHIRLEPGDTVMFHTDGVDDLLANQQGDTRCELQDTDWFNQSGRNDLSQRIAALKARRYDEAATNGASDDITVIGLTATTTSLTTTPTRRTANPVPSLQPIATPV